MTITTTDRTLTQRHFNSFGQLTTEAPEKITRIDITGTLEELLSYSYEQDVLIRRTAATESLFPTWDEDAHFAILSRGKATEFADTTRDYSTARLSNVAHGAVTVE